MSTTDCALTELPESSTLTEWRSPDTMRTLAMGSVTGEAMVADMGPTSALSEKRSLLLSAGRERVVLTSAPPNMYPSA